MIGKSTYGRLFYRESQAGGIVTDTVVWNGLMKVERKVLKPAQEELESKSPLYFWYDVNYESVGVGRPKFSTVRIYPKLQSGVQTRLASFM